MFETLTWLSHSCIPNPNRDLFLGCGGSFSKLSEAVPIAYSSLNSPRKLPTHCLWSFQIPENFLLSLSVLRYEWLCTNSSSKYIHIRTWSDANLWMMYCGHQPEFMFILLKAKFLTITIHHEENLLQTDIVNFLYTISTPGMYCSPLADLGAT